ncbi:MAG: DUF4350 domain-containing protein [Halobacteriaceae archaeon]
MAWPPDVSVPRAVLAALGVALILAVVVAASTAAASFSLFNPAWNGATALQAVASDAGARTTVADSVTAYPTTNASDTIAVVLAPEDPYTPAQRERLRRFLAAGGTLLVAADTGGVPNRLLAALNARARLDGGRLRDERRHYRGPALPIATTVAETPLMAGVDRLTLNYATPVDPQGATVLARTSPYAYVDADGDTSLDDAEPMRAYPILTREPVGAGTVLVLGDPSVFINAMLDQPDNRAWVQTLATRYDRVLLDTSHTTATPPLAAAVLAIRASPLLQAVLAVLGIGLVLGTGRDRLRRRLAAWRRRPTPPELRAADVRAVVRQRHPDWDGDRVDRVVEGIIRQRREDEGDE